MFTILFIFLLSFFGFVKVFHIVEFIHIGYNYMCDLLNLFEVFCLLIVCQALVERWQYFVLWNDMISNLFYKLEIFTIIHHNLFEIQCYLKPKTFRAFPSKRRKKRQQLKIVRTISV